MALDRQGIERRDFPIGRRGYDPTEVDAHLREVAAAFEELQRAGAPKGESSLAATAGMQVQGIIAAAERAQAEIEREAREQVQSTRDEALLDAARIREDAIVQGRTLVAAVTQATSVLLERVGSMDGELAALVESLRAGATRLTGDLAAVKGNMGELYDAASAHGGAIGPGASAAPLSAAPAREIPSSPGHEQGGAAVAPEAPQAETPAPGAEAPESGGAQGPPASAGPQAQAVSAPESAVTTTAPQGSTWTTAVEDPPAPAAKEVDEDLDGARLIALNMALNGESRADAERYLAEHFELSDRAKLIDEVYAAIEA